MTESQPPSKPTTTHSPPKHHNTNTKEWSVVKPRKGRSRKPPQIPSPSPSTSRTGPLRTLQEITSEYHRLRQDFPSKQLPKSLQRLIQDHAPNSAPITKAICLGIGTFDPADGAWEAKRRTYTQLLAFETIITELECIFQEPLFTKADTEFLQNQGYKVVDAPLASRAVTRDTFLYGVHLYRPLYAEALERELPALFVGTGWDTWDRYASLFVRKNIFANLPRLMVPMEDLRGIMEIDETYRRWEFPGDGTVFSSTCLYWRPAEGASGMRDQAILGETGKGEGIDEDEERTGENADQEEIVSKTRAKIRVSNIT